MKDYQYRTDIREDALYKAHPEIRAAFTLAQKAYAAYSRDKIDPSIPYLTHPIMVYDLMVAMGVHEPRTLAAALLHDAMEMYQPYIDDSTLMQRELQEEMVREGMEPKPAKVSARIISRYVGQMTNDTQPLESKGIAQMMRVREMLPPVKLVKIADQGANILCHLLMDNAAHFSTVKPIHFAQKARDLVSAICESGTSVKEKAVLARWQKMFRNIYEANALVLREDFYEKRDEVRRDFYPRMGDIIPAPKERDSALDDHEVYRSIRFTNKRTPTADEQQALESVKNNDADAHQFGGVVRVDLNMQGEVVGYVTWAAPNERLGHVRNYLQDRLLGALRERPYDVRVDDDLCDIVIGGQTLHEGRYHHCQTLISARDFAFNAEDNHCFDDDEDGSNLMRVSRDLERDFWMPETGGATRWNSGRSGNATGR